MQQCIHNSDIRTLPVLGVVVDNGAPTLYADVVSKKDELEESKFSVDVES